jgi:endonuclease YncB( thermonuclease family)
MRVVRSLLAVAIAGYCAAVAADISGVVVAVQDGDTLTVLDGGFRQHRVRLAGIDAPEKGQAFGSRSKLGLSQCAFGRAVDVQGSKIDRYGRLIGKVMRADEDCNLRQLALGLAWHYKAYAREQSVQDRGVYDAAESDARERRAGLWADEHPAAPWDFRRIGRMER